MITPEIKRALESPTTHRQLKDAINAFLDMDCVDAAHDAEALNSLFAARCNQILGLPQPRPLLNLTSVCPCGNELEDPAPVAVALCTTCQDGLLQAQRKGRSVRYPAGCEEHPLDRAEREDREDRCEGLDVESFHGHPRTY